MRIIEDAKVEVMIKLPDGTIKAITHPKITHMTEVIWQQMKIVMTNANKGECISYKNIEAIVEIEDSDYITICDRCGIKIDERTAYGQKEGKFTSYYCNNCKKLLQTIGRGEYSAIEERADVRYSSNLSYQE